MRDVELIVISDDAQFIRGSVREVVVSLSIAVLVVIGVIFVFMGAPTLDPYSCYRDSDRAERDYCGYLAARVFDKYSHPARIGAGNRHDCR